MNLIAIQQYAIEIIKKHDLKIFPHIVVDRLGKNTNGRAFYDKNEIIIGAEYNATATDREIKATIRHELAHIVAGKHGGRGHRKTFKEWAKLLKVPETNFSYSRSRYKWRASCACGRNWRAKRLPQHFIGLRCSCFERILRHQFKKI